MMERRLVYVSRARKDLTMADMTAILDAAVIFNSANDVTGALYFNGSSFLQVLEGTSEAVYAVSGRITSDPRHSNVEVIEDRKTGIRIFNGWAMRLFHVPTRGLAVGGWADLLPNYFADLPHNTPPHLKDMIEAFDAAGF